MKILVTGGAGYIGSHTALEALKQNHEIIILDNLERGYAKAIERIEKLSGKKIEFFQADLRNIDEIRKVISQTNPDVVIHFAAYKSVGEGQKEPEKYYENNVNATKNLLEVMGENKISKIIFSSSAAVYGMAKDLPINEETPTNPISVYGDTKLKMEKLVAEYAKKYGMQAVAFRYFNAVGTDESGELGEDPSAVTNFVPLVLQTLAGKRDEVLLFGDKFNTADGTQERDYIHVTDLAIAHIKAAEMDFEKGKLEIFNLSTGNRTSCMQVIKIAEEVTGEKLNYRVVEPRDGDPEILYGTGEKAKTMLQWQAKRDIRQSIIDQWNWTVKNPDGYKI